MTTRLYIATLSTISIGLALFAAVLVGIQHFRVMPDRPTKLPQTAVWRPTVSDGVQILPHGDWVACWEARGHDHCMVTDAKGSPEYDGDFVSTPEHDPVPSARLIPTVSDTVSPWMWSNHAGRLVPLIHLADGTVITPVESVEDLRSYVASVRKFSARLKELPDWAMSHTRASNIE